MSQPKPKKTRSRKDSKLIEMDNLLINNSIAINDGPRKKYSIHDLKAIKPMTESQRSMMESYILGNHIVATGCAGVGKTFIAAWLGLNSILSKDENQKKLIIVRSIVPSREIGHLPGDISDKTAPYELPYRDIFLDLFGSKAAYDIMKENNQVLFMPTSFVRGLTWDNSVIIVDEVQNMSDMEINSIMTRVGLNSKVIVCGDSEQNDLLGKKNETSGFDRFMNTARRMKNFDEIFFTEADIVRSGFVKEYIIARNNS